MNDPKTTQPAKKPVRGPIVEDATLEGGIDDQGRAAIRPKTQDGKVHEGFTPTDPRQNVD